MIYAAALLLGIVAGLVGQQVLRIVRNPEVIQDGEGNDYLIRYHIWRPANKALGRVYLHHMVKGDALRALHSHPWNYHSLILRGGYWERADMQCIWADKANVGEGWLYTTGGGEDMPLGTAQKWFGPGSFLNRYVGWKHAIILPPGKTAWTLIYTGPKLVEWGFFPKGQFCHHTKYDHLQDLCRED